jgi:hypothetical protein
MFRIRESVLGCCAVLGLLLAAMPAAAQVGVTPPASGATTQATPPLRPRDIQLVFEREVYHYAETGRRDPFRSLAAEAGLLPLFDDLKLRMIIYSDRPGQSVALIIDGTKKIYRVRKGDVIGNATVLDISPEQVEFSVNDFGNRRQEVLDLKQQNPKEGA